MKRKETGTLRTLILLGALSVSACGGGGGGGGAASAPSAAALSIGFGVKQPQFTWTAASGVTHYRLLENRDGASGFTQVGGNIPAAATSASIDVAVHRYNWGTARYLVEACNGTGCTTSNEVNTQGSARNAIGYFKASNTQQNDVFGRSVALSSDGNTLAVGAVGESSNATGIDGDQANNAAPAAGAVYVYTRSGNGWLQQAYVKAPNTGAGDQFGFSVALSSDGNTLAVGAHNEDSGATGIGGNQGDDCGAVAPANCATDSGAVYVYTRSGSTWTLQAYLKAPNTGAGDQFGYALGLSADGSTLAVGAYNEDSNAKGIGGNPVDDCAAGVATNCASNSGAAYVYTRSGSTWAPQVTYLKASNTEAVDQFGIAVALSGDGNTLAVGAINEASSAKGTMATVADQANNGAPFAGATYVYTRSGGTWSQQAYVKATNTNAVDKFGSSVALSNDGNTLAVGAVGEASNATDVDRDQTNNDAAFSGAVYVYTRTGGIWTPRAYVKASNTEAADQFGFAVALSSDGNTLAVGAVNEAGGATAINGNQTDNSANFAGAVYVFSRVAGAWAQQAYVKASNTQTIDQFGASVALSSDGNTLAVAALNEAGNGSGINGNQADNSASLAGAVYLY